MTRSRAAGITLFVTAIATVACYFWVDRRIAVWSHETLHGYPIFVYITRFTG
jgi:hypothetical protein